MRWAATSVICGKSCSRRPLIPHSISSLFGKPVIVFKSNKVLFFFGGLIFRPLFLWAPIIRTFLCILKTSLRIRHFSCANCLKMRWTTTYLLSKPHHSTISYIILPVSMKGYGERWWYLSSCPAEGIRWSQKEESRVGNPLIIEQNEYDIHTVVLQGAAVFFYSTDFSLFSGTFLLSNKSRQTCAYIIRCVRFFFSEKCPFLLIVYRTSLFYCRGPPGLNFFQKNSD